MALLEDRAWEGKVWTGSWTESSGGTYTAVEPKIRESMEGERLNQNFEQWLTNARKRNRIQYREGAL